MAGQTISFVDIAVALEDTARSESHRLVVMRDMAMMGRVREDSGEMQGWTRRADCLREAARIFSALVNHEAEVRALSPQLAPN